MTELKSIDRKILFELDSNSRQSFRTISKKVGLSKDAVIYRINKLKEEGIIKGYQTILDLGKLGFISFRLYLKFQNTTPKKEEEIIEFLKRQKNISWIVSIEGEYDLGLWFLCKKNKEMDLFWKELLKKYRDYIEKKWLTIPTNVIYYSRNYLLEDNNQKIEEFNFISDLEVKIDDVDLELLKVISSNARLPVLDISKIIKLNPKTVMSRLKRLEKEKIIIGYRSVFDIDMLGYQYFKIHFNLHNLTSENEKKLKNYIKENENIIFNNEILGGDDLEIEIQVRSLQDLRKQIDEIKKNFSGIIRNYKYMNFYKEHKCLSFP
ncbi:MAG: Lrp/AsnC family transcriptional regulator [Nanoarchaeota archaeon]